MQVKIVRFTIPVFNCVDELDITLESITMQSYPFEHIRVIITDFGSTDGSYEKVLDWSVNQAFQVGIYRKEHFNILEGNYAIEAYKQVIPFELRGELIYDTLINPGDELYPNFCEICMDAMTRHEYNLPDFLLCNTDIRKPDGTVKRMSPIFPEERWLNGLTDAGVFFEKSVIKRLFRIGGKFYENNDTPSHVSYANTQSGGLPIHSYAGLAKRILVLSNTLVCLQQKKYVNELFILHSLWIPFIEFSNVKRMAGNNTLSMPPNAMVNLADYALWRAVINYENLAIAENLLAMSGVICNNIMKTEQFQRTQTLLQGYVDENKEWLYKYFEGC